ncbi:hypothetical protein GCM10009677_51400 [Sphaerisporangium rubeum]
MSAVKRRNGHVGVPTDGHRPERPVGHEGLGGHISWTHGLSRGFTLCRFFRGHDPIRVLAGGLAPTLTTPDAEVSHTNPSRGDQSALPSRCYRLATEVTTMRA